MSEYEKRENSTCTPKQCPALKHRPKFSSLKLQPDYLGGDNEVRLVTNQNLWFKNICIICNFCSLIIAHFKFMIVPFILFL